MKKHPQHTFIHKRGQYGRGVRYVRKSNFYISVIRFNNKVKYLGSYNNIDEAKKAYDKKCIELNGDKAVTNFKYDIGKTIDEVRNDYLKKKMLKRFTIFERSKKIMLKKAFNRLKKKQIRKKEFYIPDYWSIFKNLNDEQKIRFIMTGEY